MYFFLEYKTINFKYITFILTSILKNVIVLCIFVFLNYLFQKPDQNGTKYAI